MEVVTGRRRRASKEDPIRRWCRDSLSVVHARLPALSSEELAAERMVDLAAFVKLTRECGVNHREFDSSTEQIEAVVEQLAGSCPLTKDSPPETLSVVHETLVSLRKQIEGAKRSRKTGGIHYTPQPVIDYILENTLEPRLRACSPTEIASLTILDPACGCGNFLAAAYRRILGWALRSAAENGTSENSELVTQIEGCRRLNRDWATAVLSSSLFGVDLDSGAIEAARRILWMICCENSVSLQREEQANETRFCPNLKAGHALLGAAFGKDTSVRLGRAFHWHEEFPSIAAHGGFDIVVGNPPYRRERDFKHELDEIAATDLGRFRSPRMDLWYYFVHRGEELLREGGTLSFITNAYWLNGTGAEKLIATFRDDLHLDELFLLGDLPVFSDVSGQHVIFRATKTKSDRPTSIKTVNGRSGESLETIFHDESLIRTSIRDANQLFHPNRVNVRSLSQSLLDRMIRCPRLGELGNVRQGIAENPSVINRRTMERYSHRLESGDWVVGEGVFSLTTEEVTALSLSEHEPQLLRPYHELAELGRYWCAPNPSRRLIYSTRQTCPEISSFPNFERHLARFRPIMEARRETVTGRNRWWHLHWPRDEALWKANKIIALQMAARPSFVPTFVPTYVSFSANVFVPFAETREDIQFLSAILNSKIVWAWLTQHAKRRGIGLELNGHVLEHIPIPKIDFDNVLQVQLHDKVVALVNRRMEMERQQREAKAAIAEISDCEAALDSVIAELYGLTVAETDEVDDLVEAA